MFVTPCFPRTYAISSVANANPLLQITPLEMLSFSCRFQLSQTVLFQTIQFSISTQFSYI